VSVKHTLQPSDEKDQGQQKIAAKNCKKNMANFSKNLENHGRDTALNHELTTSPS